MRAGVTLLLAFALLLMVGSASAHGMRTASLRIDEVTATHALVRWTTTAPGEAVRPILPATCAVSPLDGDPGSATWSLDCPGGIEGQTFAVAGLGVAVDDATVFAALSAGRSVSHLLTATSPSWTLPGTESSLDVARSYLRAGLVHIATGADHLLFLALLVLALRTWRAVLLAETAFTLSHSLAFSATALGWIHVAAAPAEACIALSLVLLALDAARPGEPAPSASRGAGLALVFGVVHGLGFAGGLREAGLPDAHAAVALVGFGAGVEIGQVAFLAVVLAAVSLLSRMRAFPRVAELATTAIGGVATAWLIERTLAALST